MTSENGSQLKSSFESALDLTSFGKYNLCMLATCCLLIIAMYIDIFGFSVMLPTIACEMELSTSQQGILSAMPLIGVMFSSYIWGFSADTLGRKASLMLAMPIGMLLNLAASMAPTYISLACLKFLSACFTSSANAAGFVLLAESAPAKYRGKFMFFMASATLLVQFVLCLVALPVLTGMSFKIYISWLTLNFRPWRLFMLITCAPGILGTVSLIFLNESPKFLFSKGHDDIAIDVLKKMYNWNTGSAKETYSVASAYLEEHTTTTDNNIFSKIWNQTAPLFRKPLLRNNLIVYFMLLCSFMTSTGYTMWVPTMTNAYFTSSDSSGKTFCEVASTAASSGNTTITDCDAAVKASTLYAVMVYSGVSGALNVLLTFIVGPLGKRRTTIMIFAFTATCGIILLFVRVSLLSIGLFFCFLYISLILANANTYLIENNPTHLRGMATCLSVVVARGFGFLSVQLIGTLLAENCTPMIIGYIVLLICGLGAACLLPPDEDGKNNNKEELSSESNL